MKTKADQKTPSTKSISGGDTGILALCAGQAPARGSCTAKMGPATTSKNEGAFGDMYENKGWSKNVIYKIDIGAPR